MFLFEFQLISAVIFSMIWYSCFLIPDTFAVLEMKKIMWPKRLVGSVWELQVIPLVYAICCTLAIGLAPDPREWTIKPTEVMRKLVSISRDTIWDKGQRSESHCGMKVSIILHLQFNLVIFRN